VVVSLALLALVGISLMLLSSRKGTSDKPDIAAVADLVKNLVYNRYDCSGAKAFSSFAVLEVDAYNSQAGGFPVYAEYALECQEGNFSITYTSSGRDKAAAAYVRRATLGGYEAFIPEIFKSLQKNMQADFDKLSEKMLRDLN
jgi:hypothetical protein